MEGLELLQRLIERELYGDRPGPHAQRQGLYREILASQDWESFARSKGTIIGYEGVLRMIEEVVQRLSQPPERPQPRAMN